MDFSSLLSMFGGMDPSYGSLPAGSISATPSAPGGLPTGVDFGGGGPSFGAQMGQALGGASGGGNQRFLSGLSAAQAPSTGLGHMLRMLMPDLFSDAGQQ